MILLTCNNLTTRKIAFVNFFLTIFLMDTLISGCSQPIPSDQTIHQNSAHDTTDDTSKTGYSTGSFGLTEISSFDVYVEKQKIHLLLSGRTITNNKKNVISYVYSEDGGYRWQHNLVIDYLPEATAKRGNDVQLAAKDNNLVAMWQTAGEFPSMGPMVSVYSIDHGQTWSEGINPAQANDRAQAHIDLITDEHGDFHAVWLEDPQESGHQSLRYARSIDSGKHWSEPVTLDDSTCSCCWNTLALSPDNHLNVLYRDMAPRDMSLMQSANGGVTWKKASSVGDFQWKFEGCPHIGGGLTSIGSDKNFQLHSVAWTGAEQISGLYYLTSIDGGQSWSLPKKLGNMATNGDVAAYKYVDKHLVATIWNELEDEGVTIWLSQSSDGGATWSAPQRLASANHSPTQPKLVATQQGFLALWTENTPSGKSVLAWYVFK